MTRQALITGGTGFIGGALARCLLQSGWSIALVVRENSSVSIIDDMRLVGTVHVYDGTTDCLSAIMEKVRPDAVFHLASLVQVQHTPADIVPLIMSNILFGTQLLDAMVVTGVRNIVVASTLWQYSGDDEQQAVNLYAATKKSFESIIDFYHSAFGVSATSLVLADTYGVGDTRPKLINFLIGALDDPATLDMSPGDQIIDISHVEDVARSFELAANVLISCSEARREMLAVSGTRLSVKQLVATVEEVSQQKINVKFGGRPYRVREIMRPAVLPELQPTWTKIRLEEGIQELLEACGKTTL